MAMAREKKKIHDALDNKDMKSIVFIGFNTAFTIICLVITFYIVYVWIHRYSLHKLSSVIDMKGYFKTEKDVSPSFSVCVTDPKLNEKIVNIAPSFNESTYLKFLRGSMYREELRLLDFDQIRFNWSAYLYDTPKAQLVSSNGSDKGYVSAGKYWKYYTSYIGLQSHERYLTYCLAFEPLHHEVHVIRVRLNKTIFDSGKRQNYKFRVFLHYPNQIIRSYQNVKYLWEDWKNKTINGQTKWSRNQMVFSVKDIEVLQRLENKDKACVKDWNRYDQIVMEKHLKRAGCRRPYQESKVINSICSNSEAMEKSSLYPSNIIMKMFDEPCRTLEKADFKFFDSHTSLLKDAPDEIFEVKFYFNFRYKEIVQYEQIDLEVSCVLS